MSGVKNFFRRLVLSVHLISKTERILLYVLIGLITIEVAYKGYGIYVDNTVIIPAQGGTYREAMIGEMKYINPIFAKTDAERSISRLVYSGLVRLDENGQIIPDLAESWEVLPDGLTYQFILRDQVYFHNGQLLESKDIVNTIEAIKNPEMKSPYHDIWSEVSVSSLNAKEVEIKIPRQNGSFIFNCLQGIVSSTNINGSMAETVNGTGPYRLKSMKDIDINYTYLELERNTTYFGTPPYISLLQLSIYASELPADVKGNTDNFTALSGTEIDNQNFINQNFQVGRTLFLIPNLKNPLLTDAATRARVMKFDKFDSPIKLKLISLDGPKQKAKIEEIKQQVKDKNIELNIEILSSVDFYKKANARDFDLILFGNDYGYDRDPYAFWHSSQISKNNLASFADKALDIKLEDARMILDINDRNAKYNEIFQILQSQNLIVIYPSVKYDFSVNKELFGLNRVIGSRPEDRYNSILNWYLKIERVKKR